MTPENPDRHNIHIRFPRQMWMRLVKAAQNEYLPSANAAVVQAVKEWLERRDREGGQ